MATNGITNATTVATAAAQVSSANGTSSAADMESRFLNLLITQLKNQDPLNPTDANQMTAQLSQTSTVSGIEKLNASMDKLLASYAGTQNMEAAAMIGKTVLIAGNGLALGGDGALGGISLEGAAERVTVTIKDAAGNTVQTQELGSQTAGLMNFVWDGKSDSGASLPAGNYSFAVKASNGDITVPSKALEAGMVNALTLSTEGVSMQLQNNKSIAYSDILQIMN